MVEHGYPAALSGWIVVALKRHAEALHDVTPPEFEELGVLLGEVVRVLRAELQCDKEYVAQLSELNGYKHVHFHIIARPRSLPESLRGKELLLTFRTTPEEAVPPDTIRALCESLAHGFRAPRFPEGERGMPSAANG
jgi:diadenosine tetraphosphate (Ap4A) HIT family hydrolase